MFYINIYYYNDIINIIIIFIISNWAWEAQIQITLSPKTYSVPLTTQHLTLCIQPKAKTQIPKPPKILVLTLDLNPIPQIQIPNPIPFLAHYPNT